MAQSPENQAARMIASLPEKTGKSLGQWQNQVAESGAVKHGEIVRWLKSEHGMTHGYANLIAHLSLNPKVLESDERSDSELIEAQYRGKESLHPIYEALCRRVAAFGEDVEFAPKKSYVSLRRSTQFALIQPSTRTRVDVGIKNKGRAVEGRLEDSGKWNSMVTHRVRLENVDGVDDELIEWLREAYENA